MSVVLSEHLPLLATAPDGIQKLRGLILELAVRGKLVPQDPNDETASELLKRIAKERARLEAEGTCKKSKVTPLVGEDERPFELPDGWEWVLLATIGNIFNGNSINSDEKESKFRRKDGLPYIATKDVGYGLTPLDYGNGVRIPETEPNFKMARKGAVFICAEGGSAGKKCGFTDRNVFFGNKLFANETFAGIPPRFILYLYLSPMFRQQFSSAMSGIIGGVSIAKFVEIPIPLPPLAEQHRIVAKVNELMALCDRLEAEQTVADAAHAKLVETLLSTLTQSNDAAALATNWQRLAEHFDPLFTTESSLDALKQTILQLAVMGKLVPQDPKDEPASELLKRIAKERARLEAEGVCKKSKSLPPVDKIEKPFAVPDSWEWLKFGTVVDLINGDRSKNYPNREEYVPTGVAWINTGHIEPDGTLATEGMHFITTEKFDSLRSGKIEAHDLVYCLRGATFGKTAFVTPYTDGAIASSLVIVRPHLSSLKNYLFLFLTSPLGRSQIFRFDNGSAQPNLSANSVTLYAFPLPPLAEQHRIVAKVDALMALCDRLKTDLAESRTRQTRLSATLIETALQAA